MTYRCELTVVIQSADGYDVISEERIANNPVLGLDLLWTECKRQLSMQDGPLSSSGVEVQVIGFVDPILDGSQAEMQKQRQRLLDRSKGACPGPHGTQP